MSVHGEYSRALENVVVCVRAIDRPEREAWLASLEGVRLGAQPDLTTAARSALEVLGEVDPTARSNERLSAVCAHLASHCRVVLGLPAEE